MDCASQDPRKKDSITAPSDRLNTAVRHPPVLAQAGESSPAWSPTRCCSSLSSPSSPGAVDSVEPRCISHTVAVIIRKNWRYSDCQFSETSTAKLDEVM